jgi:hypothetical protein
LSLFIAPAFATDDHPRLDPAVKRQLHVACHFGNRLALIEIVENSWADAHLLCSGGEKMGIWEQFSVFGFQFSVKKCQTACFPASTEN